MILRIEVAWDSKLKDSRINNQLKNQKYYQMNKLNINKNKI